MTEHRLTIDAAGYPFSALIWGDRADRALLLIHGVTASAEVWWRVGPALAATGGWVVAVDLPGHGETGRWQGRHRFRESAEDVVAFVRAAGLDREDLQVVGHSWGAMVAAALPAAGLRPATLVLLDPPAIPLSLIGQMASDPTWRTFDRTEEAIVAIARMNPGWPAGDVAASARAMMSVDVAAARAVVLDNGDWDAGLADLAAVDPSIDLWVVRGDPATGGLTLNWAAEAYRPRLGDDHVITIAGAPHGPQRTHPRETVEALLRALDGQKTSGTNV